MASIKDLIDNQIHQKVTAQLRIPQYQQEQSFFSGLESFSVYQINAESSILNGYFYTLDFVSDDVIYIEDLTDLDAELSLRDESNPLNSKKIHGRIIKAKEHGSVARKKLYTITIASPFHYLSLNQRYEIYQEKSVPDIISEVFARYNVLLNLELEVKIDLQSIPKRHTCTQYKQSDLDFIQMLCAEEGYVLLFDASSKDPYTITLCELNEHASRVNDSIEASISFSKEFSVSAQVQDYYDSKRPSQNYEIQTGENLSTSSLADKSPSAQLRTQLKKQKLRDKIENLDESLFKDLSRHSNIETQRGLARGVSITGRSQELRLVDGSSVSLKDIKGHKNTQALIISTKIQASFPNALDEYVEVTGDIEPAQYSVEYIAVPSDVIYRPELVKNKPLVKSIQTAIVSNANEETSKYANEIDVNEFGEIRVIFHFDEKRPTSCYIPLANNFSGDGYGTQFIPRVNSEVIVSFINGDIDRPIITGAIHNGENRHPYSLPKEKTRSFIKTQTTPQYEDKEGYNELLFEDKQNEEVLSLRAQNDYHLHALEDSNTHVQNTKKSIIGNDSELTIKNDYTRTIANDSRVSIGLNSISVIEKDEITTVKEDLEVNILKDQIGIVNNNKLNVVEQDLIERIKGTLTKYTEKDAKEKYLQNLFLQVGAQLGVDVTDAFELKADSIKETAKTIDLNSANGVSLKVGGNTLTIDSSGIHFKTPNYDANSGNGGVTSSAVVIEDVKVPEYEKLRVTGLEASIIKQDDISQELIYTATVEKCTEGEWVETTDLEETQELQLNWYFIKNNDDLDTEVITDKLTDDEIVIDGLTMTVIVQDDNLEQFGHAHCYVNTPDEEDCHALSELKRQLDVEQVLGRNLLEVNATEINYRVQLNINNPTPEEIKDLKVEIHEKDETGAVSIKSAEVKADLTITHEFEKLEKDAPKRVEVRTKVFPSAYPSNSGEGISYIRPMLEDDKIMNARPDNKDSEYINAISDETYTIRADTSLEEGTEVITTLNIVGKDGSILASVAKDTYVENQKVEQEFDIEQIIEEKKLVKENIQKFKGEIQCQEQA